MELNYSFKIDKVKWNIYKFDSGELKFTAEVPFDYVDPLWYDWDSAFMEMCDISHLPSLKVNPHKVVRQMVCGLIDIVNRGRITHFYFPANTGRKALFYKVLTERYIGLLGNRWSYQISDDYWFFFYKESQ